MPREKLFDLIHALSSGEKKFFRQYAARHVKQQEPLYLAVFDVIEKQSHYDEKDLKNQFRNTTSLENFHNLKAYLHEMILRALVELQSRQSAYRQVLELLCSAEILSEKLLLPDAVEILNKAERIARDYGFPELTAEILRFKKIVAVSSELFGKRKFSSSTDDHGKAGSSGNGLVLGSDCRQRYLQAMLVDWRIIEQGTREFSEMDKLFRQPILQRDVHRLHETEKVFYYGIKFMEKKMRGEKNEAFIFIKKMVDSLEKIPQQFYFNKFMLLYGYFNLISEQLHRAEWKKAEHEINKLKNLPVFSEQNRYFQLHFLFASELNYFSALNKEEACLKLIGEFAAALGKRQHRVNRHLEFMNYYSTMTYLVKIKQYERSLTFINYIQNDRAAEEETPVYNLQAKLLNMVVQYELQNYDMLDQYIRRMEYYLETREKRLTFAHSLLKFFKKISRTKMDPSAAFQSLEKQLADLPKNIIADYSFKNFLECGWLQQHGIQLSFIPDN